MRNTVAKRLRRKAEELTVGAHISQTKEMYKELKKRFKLKTYPESKASRPAVKYHERTKNGNSRQRRRIKSYI